MSVATLGNLQSGWKIYILSIGVLVSQKRRTMALKDLSKIKSEKDNALKKRCRDDVEVLIEGEIVGFAILVWDRDGKIGTGLRIDGGIIGRTMAPMLCHDALLKHVTMQLTIEELEADKRIPR
jgi:hypothetical protein